MHDLVGIAQRLRQVKKAHEHFLALWALECFWNQPRALERAWRDIDRAPAQQADNGTLSPERVSDD
jgi:hypothetical protein